MPDRLQVGTAITIAFLLLAGSVRVLFLDDLPLPAIHAFIPSADAILLVSDLVTSTLLFAQAAVFRSRAFMALAAGYLFTGAITVTHALTFPGAFSATGLLGAGPSSTTWVAVFWRAGFPLSICVYALLRPKDSLRFKRPLVGIAISAGAAVAVAISLSVLATAGLDLLPVLTVSPSNWHYPNFVATVGVVIGVCLAAIVLLWRRRKSRLDIWLLLSLWIWLIHLLLVVSTSGRFTPAWYFAHGVGSVSHVVVTLALIADASRTYARLALSVSALKGERESKLVTMDAVTAALAHEVGQPLTAVTTNAMAGMNWLNREKPDIEMAIQSFRATIEAGHRTTEVIKSIRAAFRKGPGAATEFCLNQLVRETASLLHRDLAAKKIRLQLALDETLPPIEADRIQIQRVLTNLLTNAIESLAATRDRPRLITVRSENLDDWQALLELSDTGVGISPGIMAHIFEPFFTTKANGTGLGLTLCRTIVEEHGGSLWASRDGERGAAFVLQLPHCGRAPLGDVEPYG